MVIPLLCSAVMFISDPEKLFVNFIGRTDALRLVTRYNSYQPMFYRSNLVTHSKHVLWLVQSLLAYAEQVFSPSLDTTKAQLMALVHDDPEIVMGDIEMGKKLKMTAEQLAEVGTKEQNAIEIIVRRFPSKLGSYSYETLLKEAIELQSVESRLVKLADKFDAFGEALHEIFAGNTRFANNVTNEYGVIPLPTDYYSAYLSGFSCEYPEFKELFQLDAPLFKKPVALDIKSIASHGVPHTQASLPTPTEYAHYNFWKEVISKFSDQEELSNLYCQKEFALENIMS